MAKAEIEVDEGLSRLARELGRRGGMKDGKARAEKLTRKRRSAIAKKAAKARWAKKRKREPSHSGLR